MAVSPAWSKIRVAEQQHAASNGGNGFDMSMSDLPGGLTHMHGYEASAASPDMMRDQSPAILDGDGASGVAGTSGRVSGGSNNHQPLPASTDMPTRHTAPASTVGPEQSRPSAFRRYCRMDAASPHQAAGGGLRLFGGAGSSAGSFRQQHIGFQYPELRGRRSAVLVRATAGLRDMYSKAGYSYSPHANPRRVLTKPSVGCKNDGYDNENSDLIMSVNDVLVNGQPGTGVCRKYVVQELLGQGTFGQVVSCWSEDYTCQVAVKVIKNQPAYYHQARVEIGLLQLLNSRCDPHDAHHIVRMIDFFCFRKHLCLVFEKLDVNLFELLRRNGFRGLSLSLVQMFLRQLLESLVVLRDASIIHCDLKPENILLKNPHSGDIKLIDFGSACFENRTVYSYIQSRFYRSPEVVLGHGYTVAIDVWSLGCVAAELFLGLPLFPGASEHDLITRIVQTFGMPPTWLLQQAKHSEKFFTKRMVQDASGNLQSHYTLTTQAEFEAKTGAKAPAGKRYFSHTSLPDIISVYPFKQGLCDEDIGKERRMRESFIDFLLGVLELDPRARWTPRQAASHPFITGERFTGPFAPQPDPRNPSLSLSPDSRTHHMGAPAPIPTPAGGQHHPRYGSAGASGGGGMHFQLSSSYAGQAGAAAAAAAAAVAAAGGAATSLPYHGHVGGRLSSMAAQAAGLAHSGPIPPAQAYGHGLGLAHGHGSHHGQQAEAYSAHSYADNHHSAGSGGGAGPGHGAAPPMAMPQFGSYAGYGSSASAHQAHVQAHAIAMATLQQMSPNFGGMQLLASSLAGGGPGASQLAMSLPHTAGLLSSSYHASAGSAASLHHQMGSGMAAAPSGGFAIPVGSMGTGHHPPTIQLGATPSASSFMHQHMASMHAAAQQQQQAHGHQAQHGHHHHHHLAQGVQVLAADGSGHGLAYYQQAAAAAAAVGSLPHSFGAAAATAGDMASYQQRVAAAAALAARQAQQLQQLDPSLLNALVQQQHAYAREAVASAAAAAAAAAAAGGGAGNSSQHGSSQALYALQQQAAAAAQQVAVQLAAAAAAQQQQQAALRNVVGGPASYGPAAGTSHVHPAPPQGGSSFTSTDRTSRDTEAAVFAMQIQPTTSAASHSCGDSGMPSATPPAPESPSTSINQNPGDWDPLYTDEQLLGEDAAHGGNGRSSKQLCGGRRRSSAAELEAAGQQAGMHGTLGHGPGGAQGGAPMFAFQPMQHQQQHTVHGAHLQRAPSPRSPQQPALKQQQHLHQAPAIGIPPTNGRGSAMDWLPQQGGGGGGQGGASAMEDSGQTRSDSVGLSDEDGDEDEVQGGLAPHPHGDGSLAHGLATTVGAAMRAQGQASCGPAQPPVHAWPQSLQLQTGGLSQSLAHAAAAGQGGGAGPGWSSWGAGTASGHGLAGALAVESCVPSGGSPTASGLGAIAHAVLTNGAQHQQQALPAAAPMPLQQQQGTHAQQHSYGQYADVNDSTNALLSLSYQPHSQLLHLHQQQQQEHAMRRTYSGAQAMQQLQQQQHLPQQRHVSSSGILGAHGGHSNSSHVPLHRADGPGGDSGAMYRMPHEDANACAASSGSSGGSRHIGADARGAGSSSGGGSIQGSRAQNQLAHTGGADSHHQQPHSVYMDQQHHMLVLHGDGAAHTADDTAVPSYVGSLPYSGLVPPMMLVRGALASQRLSFDGVSRSQQQ